MGTASSNARPPSREKKEEAAAQDASTEEATKRHDVEMAAPTQQAPPLRATYNLTLSGPDVKWALAGPGQRLGEEELEDLRANRKDEIYKAAAGLTGADKALFYYNVLSNPTDAALLSIKDEALKTLSDDMLDGKSVVNKEDLRQLLKLTLNLNYGCVFGDKCCLTGRGCRLCGCDCCTSNDLEFRHWLCTRFGAKVASAWVVAGASEIGGVAGTIAIVKGPVLMSLSICSVSTVTGTVLFWTVNELMAARAATYADVVAKSVRYLMFPPKPVEQQQQRAETSQGSSRQQDAPTAAGRQPPKGTAAPPDLASAILDVMAKGGRSQVEQQQQRAGTSQGSSKQQDALQDARTAAGRQPPEGTTAPPDLASAILDVVAKGGRSQERLSGSSLRLAVHPDAPPGQQTLHMQGELRRRQSSH